MPTRSLLLGLAATALCGCSGTQMRYNHTTVRDAMMRYEDDQIMDNLIRAKNGYSIMHFEIKSLNSTVDTNVSANISGGQTVEHTSSLAGAVLTAAETVTRPLSFSATPERKSQMNVDSAPIQDKDALYDAYVALGKLAVRSTEDGTPKPPKSEVHYGMKWKDGNYYWIPVGYRDEFFALCMRAVTTKGWKPPGNAPAVAIAPPAGKNAPPTGKKPRDGGALIQRFWKAIEEHDAPTNALSPEARAMEEAVREFRKLRLQSP